MRTRRFIRLSKLNRRSSARALLLFALCAATAIPLSAQTFTTLHIFDSADGADPEAALVQARDGNFYGTTANGGANLYGTVFEITPSGTLSTIYSFCPNSGCTDGENPYGGLIQAADGDFYGVTLGGGANSGSCLNVPCGTVFKITPGGTLTTLHSFCSQSGCTDGQYPEAGLVQGTDGNFYGTTDEGGANNSGTVFRITPGGTLTTLYTFCSQSGCADGGFPVGALVQATDGNFYGTTEGGGANCVTAGGCGTVFKISPGGVLTTLYSFCAESLCADGEYPYAGLLQAADGNFYGITPGGGGANNDGTVFKITPDGTLTTLYSFCSKSNCTDGENPYGGLVQATDGEFYGITYLGGSGDFGTVFKITPSGKLSTLYTFCSRAGCTDGEDPFAGLLLATNGNFYGTTSAGGDGCFSGCGTVFSVSGLTPFVETLPASGKVGKVVEILGTNLVGVTSVSFSDGGTGATFTVVSNSLITATVPTGATSGFVKVYTALRTLKSNKRFIVTP
jgi:uncharacterized repeat protein (TIGR03803 family)